MRQMKVFTGDTWRDGFLDYHRHADEYRLEVLAWRNLERLEGVYFTRPLSLRLLWNYLRDLGLGPVWRKVRSRWSERQRNHKFLAIGLGRVVEPGQDAVFDQGQLVAFLAPCHPCCPQRLCLPAWLMAAAPESMTSLPPDQAVALFAQPAGNPDGRAWWSGLRAWSRHGQPAVAESLAAAVKDNLLAELAGQDWSPARLLPRQPAGEPAERRPAAQPAGGGRKRAVLFGYGNYAKTVLLPAIAKHLRVECVHEIDPLQMTMQPGLAWDTSPLPRAGETYDAHLIAGFHHTHAPLAALALAAGATAVIEKPIATTPAQRDELLRALRASPGKAYCCFQKRYSPLNETALRHLGAGRGEAVNYHCIVYEVPLPERHWYRWPASGSRILSNGCHWIDHFLFLNRYSRPTGLDIHLGPDGTANCTMVLENRAMFSMVLTERGSERLGLQEHVELRRGEVTVSIVNSSHLTADTRARLSRSRIHRMLPYRVMYDTIGRRVAGDNPGDSLESLEISTAVVLEFEARLQQKLAAAGRAGGE